MKNEATTAGPMDLPVMPLAAWEDPMVQRIYKLLCSDEAPPNREEHWEGWIARKIVGELFGGPLPTEATEEANDAIRAMLAEYNYPANPQNAGRAGWRAARLYALRHNAGVER